jgi:hypothetical protein
MFPARYAKDVHVQDFVLNDKFLLPILKAFTQCTHFLSLPKILDIFSLCVLLEQSVASTNSSPAVLSTAPHMLLSSALNL